MKELKELHEDIIKNFVEKGADLEHDRWTRWYLWQRDNSNSENIERWNKQAKTSYFDLSELEKESDRKETRNYIPFLEQALARQLDEVVNIINNSQVYYITLIKTGIDKLKGR